jgi:hypothetical protein
VFGDGLRDSVLKLAQATRAGAMLGHSETVERYLRYLEKYGDLPAADWQAIAGIGPELDTLVQQLRHHVSLSLRDFKAELPVQTRADLLRRALEQDLIGETLSLLAQPQQIRRHLSKIVGMREHRKCGFSVSSANDSLDDQR